jgi:hypothetical protein
MSWVTRGIFARFQPDRFDSDILHFKIREIVMTESEKLAAYEELLRRILVHADSYGDVHWQIKLWNDQNPDILKDKPYYCFVR